MLTDEVGAGIVVGDDVRLDGVQIGRIAAIEPTDRHLQLTLDLEKGSASGLTDGLGIDFVPANLFGVSEVELQRGTAGDRLSAHSIVDLTGTRSGRARDATISTLLNQLGSFSNDVLSPELVPVLQRISTGTKAFTPLIETIISITRDIADTQRLPSSFLLGQYGSMLGGLPSTTDGLLQLLGAANNAEYMRSPEHVQKFDASARMLETELLPSVTSVLATGERYFAGTTATLVPVLAALAHIVPTPEQSGHDLSELLDRLNQAMPDTPGGPVLNVSVDLRGVPGLAAPLTAALAAGQGAR
ncbi:MlaD family protein [Nocardia heshunensis]